MKEKDPETEENKDRPICPRCKQPMSDFIAWEGGAICYRCFVETGNKWLEK